MNMALYATFCLAVSVLVLMPGPIVTLVVANSLKHGTRSGLTTVAGSMSGGALLLAAGAIGLSGFFALLSQVLEEVRWLGAAYLVWLGIQSWRLRGLAAVAPAQALEQPAGPSRARHRGGFFLQGFVVACTNPKTILFYIAFFPQFLDRHLPLERQLWIMSLTMLLTALIGDSSYAVLAGRLRNWFSAPGRRRLQSRISGSLLIGTGLGLLLARRGS